MLVLSTMLACTGPEGTRLPEETAPPTSTEPPWGVVEECSSRAEEGFAPFYEDGTAILVYGDSPEDRVLAEQVYEWYANAFVSLEMKPASELSDADRRRNLFVLGMPSTNSLISELDPLPVRFDESSFEFGGYTYSEPGNGIALIAPSTFADDAWVLLYAGNTLDGAYSTFTVYTGASDYTTTRGRGVVQQEGAFCHDDAWGWFRRYDDDLRKPWEKWTRDLLTVETDHHVFLFEDGSEGDQDRDWFPEWQEDEYARAVAKLDVVPLDWPIQTYLYTTRDLKTEMTGISGNGHANDLNYEVHALYGEGVHAVGAHEDVHVIAWHRVGDANSALMGEGLAVWVDETWQGEDLDHWATAYRDAGEIPPLQELVDDFWSYDDLMTYPLAGDFVGFLEESWGLDAMKRIYAAPDLELALQEETSLDLAGVEAAWLASIP